MRMRRMRSESKSNRPTQISRRMRMRSKSKSNQDWLTVDLMGFLSRIYKQTAIWYRQLDGSSQRVWSCSRCMTQISKIVNSMKDLFDFCRENKVGPIEGLKVYPRHATAAKLQMQKMQEMELLASAQGLPTDRNTLNKLMALHPGLNNQMNNHHQMVGPGAYQNLLLRHNSMNSNANSLQQEASSSFNNSNRIPSSTFQGAAALIPGSMRNLPGSALSSAHLPSRQPQQLQQRSLSSNSLLQQTHSTGSQGNQALQQQMIQQLPQEMSNNSRGGQQSLPCPSVQMGVLGGME